MKTAISINKDIYNEAEQTAQQLGLTRSKLYSMAILEFVRIHKPDAITANLNEVYSNTSSKLDDDINQLNYTLLAQDEW
jgi:Leucine-rich repeat (LRR) protein